MCSSSNTLRETYRNMYRKKYIVIILLGTFKHIVHRCIVFWWTLHLYHHQWLTFPSFDDWQRGVGERKTLYLLFTNVFSSFSTFLFPFPPFSYTLHQIKKPNIYYSPWKLSMKSVFELCYGNPFRYIFQRISMFGVPILQCCRAIRIFSALFFLVSFSPTLEQTEWLFHLDDSQLPWRQLLEESKISPSPHWISGRFVLHEFILFLISKLYLYLS